MNDLVWIGTVADALMPLMNTLLVKGLLVACLGFAMIPLLRHASAKVRYRYWTVYFAALLVLPLLGTMGATIPVKIPYGTWSPVIQSTANQASVDQAVIPPNLKRAESTLRQNPPTTLTDLAWHQRLTLIWLLGTCAAGLWFAMGHFMLWRAVRTGSSKRLSRWHEALAALILVEKPAKLVIAEVKAPMLWGFFRPVLLLPAEARDWSSCQIRMTLIHELVHLQRGDLRFNLLSNVATAVHWYNPLVWLAQRRFAFEQEQSCDDAVLAAGTQAAAYGELLLKLAWQSKAPALPAPAAVSIGFGVKDRLYNVLTPLHEKPRQRAWATLMAVALIACVGLPITLFGLEPTTAEPAPLVTQKSTLQSGDQVNRQPAKATEPIPMTVNRETAEDILEQRLESFSDMLAQRLAEFEQQVEHWYDVHKSRARNDANLSLQMKAITDQLEYALEGEEEWLDTELDRFEDDLDLAFETQLQIKPQTFLNRLEALEIASKTRLASLQESFE